jgi:hypothetical protein
MNELCREFVEIIHGYQRDPRNPRRLLDDPPLSDEKRRTLCEVVCAAGWENTADVINKELHGNYRDQDGSATGETYPINGFLPYAAVDEKGNPNHGATIWLNNMARDVSNKRSSEDVANWLEGKIVESRPLDPIQLNKEGDFLKEYPPSPCGTHTRDDTNLMSCIGVHAYCNSYMDRRRATKNKDAINCRGCNLRVLFPSELQTYGELRAYLLAWVVLPE